jgi:minor extracellular serine protease Vpr
MRFTTSRVAAVLAAAFSILGSNNAGAVRPGPAGDEVTIKPAWTPLGVSNQPVTVVLQLTGASVAEQQGDAGRKFSDSEKRSAKAQLRSQQDPVRAGVEGLGGTVLAQYQAAYNGVKVRIDRARLSQLATLPGVVAVRPLQLVKPNNVRGIPAVGAPTVWQNLGIHGEGVKVAIIDTGIDWTHANFGGPGTAAAYTAAHAVETQPADPRYFGPNAPRIKGGIDLVGDSYNADPNSDAYQPIPHPDPNPLDCNGHGSHVAGTAAGSGVTAGGTTYTGPYNGSTLANPAAFAIGPGVAPKADIYSVRVFGCEGSTDVTVDAIEWAVDNDMDVINMSLGSTFGSKDDPSAVASTNAAKAGVIVVASAGNDGPSPYVTGSPASAVGAISVAATDPWQTLPGATIAAGGVNVQAINANGYPLSGTQNYTLKVLKDNPATSEDESIGCSVAAFGTVAPGTIVVVNRGVCARVAKAIYGQQAGAAAVVMANNAASFPPFEGPITNNPDTGESFNVTIPFLGVKGPFTSATSDAAKLRAVADGTATAVAAASIANPNFTGFASFTSAGPRDGDSGLKPDVSAPGVSIISTGNGTGNAGAAISGTSMAAPHVTGVAALTRQAHPTWSVEDIKAAIVNTGSPSAVAGYATRLGGTGLVQVPGSAGTQVVATTSGGKFGTSLNFGFAELKDSFKKTKEITLRNRGTRDAIFTVAQANASGSAHTVSLSRTSVRVPARGAASVGVTLNVPAASAGDSNAFRDVAGLIELKPASAADNGGITLRVPYYLVPRALSDVDTKLGRLSGTNPSAVATVTNKKGVIAGDADFYSWGLFASRLDDEQDDGEDGDRTGKPTHDVRAAGVQSFAFPSTADPNRRLLVFAVNGYNRWSNASVNEFDIYVDVDGDGKDDYVIVGADSGLVTAGAANGVMGAFVFDLNNGGATSSPFGVSAPTDSSTVELPILSSQLCRSTKFCLSATNPRLTYHIVSFDIVNGGSKAVPGLAKYNPWGSAVSDGGFAGAVAPGATDNTSVVISVNSAEAAKTPPLGVMVVTFDNKAGKDEAELIPLGAQ